MSHLVCACAARPSVRASAPTRGFVPSMVNPPWRAMLAQFLAYQTRERQACGEAGRLDAIEMHEPWHAVLARSLDLEVGGGLSRSRSLGPDTGIARRERTVGQSRPITADRGIEAIG